MLRNRQLRATPCSLFLAGGTASEATMAVRQRIARFCIRLAWLLITAGVLLALPEPPSDDILHFKNALIALGFVIALGKLLFDTLFYDRYL